MKKKKLKVGGQAVIEGVMMRGSDSIATAVRRKDDTIEIKKQKFNSITEKKKFLNIPIIRGFISLIEMFLLGIKTLTFSANRAELDFEEETKKKSIFREKLEEFFSYAFAFGLAFLLFAFIPYKISSLFDLGKNSIIFNAMAGVIRIFFFIGYVWTISLMKDVRRLFEFHGAEHKAVFAFENEEKLEPKNVKKYSTLHPRCGTSFMFFVLLVSILIFSIFDTILIAYIGKMPSIIQRIGFHFMLIPLVSGTSYEILKLSGKNINHPLVKLMTFPGLAIQRITTKEPDEKQLEVAIVALKAALGMEQDKNCKINYIEE